LAPRSKMKSCYKNVQGIHVRPALTFAAERLSNSGPTIESRYVFLFTNPFYSGVHLLSLPPPPHNPQPGGDRACLSAPSFRSLTLFSHSFPLPPVINLCDASVAPFCPLGPARMTIDSFLLAPHVRWAPPDFRCHFTPSGSNGRKLVGFLDSLSRFFELF